MQLALYNTFISCVKWLYLLYISVYPLLVFQEALFNLFAGQTKLNLLMISCLPEKLIFLAGFKLAGKIVLIW